MDRGGKALSSLRALRTFLGSVLPLVIGGAGCGKVVASSTPGADASPTDDVGLASRPPIVIGKVDLLLMIDNSEFMGDKQAYFAQAIAELLGRLVTPNCVDASGSVAGISDLNGNCATGALEFPPVHDLHVGMVSSSLGPRAGDQTSKGSAGGVCLPTATVTLTENGVPVQVPDHDDDQAHLLPSASAAPSMALAQCAGGPCPAFPLTAPLGDAPEGFLDWFPVATSNGGRDAGTGAPAITDVATLETDFSDLAYGIQQYGCGIESQLESWYRFLIQPDPYDRLAVDSQGKAQWVGVDTTILQERRDFLRPDSAVVIVDLTDENDSEIDVRSLGGQGYFFMSDEFNPPRGTSACNTNPGDPACMSCADPQASPTDPNCVLGPYVSPQDWGMDMNLRHVHMKAKYGVDPQYPIERYVTGLTSAAVPDRNGEYPPGASSYVGSLNCVNPLFAGALPDPATLSSSIATEMTLAGSDEQTLCNLPSGPRPASTVFYLHIGGVPHQLLQDAQGNTKTTLTSADWVRIVGTDPENYDYSGIDPHMIESEAPRTGPWPFPLASLLPGETPIQSPTAPDGADPWNGREWVTNMGAHANLNDDLEYACIFPLATPRDCTNPNDQLACSCSTLPSAGLTPAETSPVCDPTMVTQQDYAKTYPTIRELLLAEKLGPQGVAASICPIDVADNAAGTDPNYGYRPAMSVLLARMQPTLAFSGK
jgi:hypothetical protein